jgi:hypothetical protein
MATSGNRTIIVPQDDGLATVTEMAPRRESRRWAGRSDAAVFADAQLGTAWIAGYMLAKLSTFPDVGRAGALEVLGRAAALGLAPPEPLGAEFRAALGEATA